MTADTFAPALLAWHDAHRRDLPWRRSRTPYRVTVSEFMLQQTTVSAAVPFFERFVARFPGWAALAAAPLDDVLSAWSGLGYYRRARSLHATAKAIVCLHGGRFPDDLKAALALPGVGPYTAGAVLSLAMGRRLPAVDGNVGRVLSRHSGLPLDASRPAGRRALEAEVLSRMPGQRPGEFNEALMELGATTCTPRAPACGRCPVATSCVALREGTVGALPPRRERAPLHAVSAVAAVIARADGRVLLRRRPESEQLMPGLWELPGSGASASSRARLGVLALAPLGGGAVLGEAGSVTHVVTTRRITVRLYDCALKRRPRDGADVRWVDPAGVGDLALTGAARRALRLVAAGRRTGRELHHVG